MSTCVSTLADANIAVVAGATIELCAGTYNIGTPLDDTFTSFAGGQPLIIDQSGVTVRCGADGASTNGCIFDGGFGQLLLDGADTATFQGITFTGQMESSTVVSGGLAPRNVLDLGFTGTITFNDCVFQDINSTGYIIDIRPTVFGVNTGATANVVIQNSVFANIKHSFDAVNTDTGTLIQFNTVSFDNVTHQLPEGGIDVCASATSGETCNYTSSIIHIGSTNDIEQGFPTTTVEESYVGVTISNSEFYTSLIRTFYEWGGPKSIVNFPFTTLITSTNNTIYNQDSRTANDDYCEGGYAAAYNSATLIDWYCKRVDYSYLPVEELLRCGYDCNMNGEFSTLLEALEITNLATSLTTDTNNVAIFAPDNAAFEQLPPGLLDSLMEDDTDTLTQLLLYHVTAEDAVDTTAIDFGLPAALTAQGESVSFTPLGANGYYMVDAANIIYEDWDETPNGGKIIHVIDRVINPSTIPILPSFSQLVESLNLTEFIAAADSVGFDPDLESDVVYTIFAPSNTAIQNANLPTDKTELTKILNHHIVEGNYSIADLQGSSCQTLQSLESLNVKVTFSNGEVKWNDDFTNSSVVDQQAYNGQLHVVDGVLGTSSMDCTSTAARASSVTMSMAVGLVGTILATFVF